MLSHRFSGMAAGALAALFAALPAQAETIRVVVDKMAFSPAEITAKVGDTIEWVNKDSFAHTATVKGGWEVMLPVKKSGSIVLDKAQSIDYYCRFHPNMKGHITITP